MSPGDQGVRAGLARGQIITLAAAAADIGLASSSKYLQRLARSGSLPAFRLPGGRDWLIWAQDWRDWQAERAG